MKVNLYLSESIAGIRKGARIHDINKKVVNVTSGYLTTNELGLANSNILILGKYNFHIDIKTVAIQNANNTL
jgi:hypothetical protein|tara:strand:+ start:573 stop:788 length:216 start_codon:yes stop_codon:yes gene_type:complete